MAETITIEGSILPSAYLARGERQVVRADDPVAEHLVLQGYAVVVSADTVPDDEAPEGTGQLVPDEVNAPARSASREGWAEFLAQHPGGFVTEGKDRAALIAEWDAYQTALATPATD